jgi:preprotein translocase subunit SecB
MQQATFSIVSYQFDKVLIDLSKSISQDMSISFDAKGEFEEEHSLYTLVFLVKVFNSDSVEDPFVQVQCQGVFKFSEVKSINDIPDFFYKNCIAILFPYVRAYISLVTTQANIPGVILPTYNLTGLGEKLKEATSLK